jgi:hypothetical protein
MPSVCRLARRIVFRLLFSDCALFCLVFFALFCYACFVVICDKSRSALRIHRQREEEQEQISVSSECFLPTKTPPSMETIERCGNNGYHDDDRKSSSSSAAAFSRCIRPLPVLNLALAARALCKHRGALKAHAVPARLEQAVGPALTADAALESVEQLLDLALGDALPLAGSLLALDHLLLDSGAVVRVVQAEPLALAAGLVEVGSELVAVALLGSERRLEPRDVGEPGLGCFSKGKCVFVVSLVERGDILLVDAFEGFVCLLLALNNRRIVS